MRLASRVKRLEAKSGSCPACGGAGVLAIVLDDEPVPPGCRRCGHPPLVMRLVELTKEEWDEQQQAVRTHRPA